MSVLSVEGLPARVCYVRVGVGSAVSSRLLLSDREQVRDNELKLVPGPGSSRIIIFSEPAIPESPKFSLGEHNTTEQTRVLSESDVYFSCLTPIDIMPVLDDDRIAMIVI